MPAIDGPLETAADGRIRRADPLAGHGAAPIGWASVEGAGLAAELAASVPVGPAASARADGRAVEGFHGTLCRDCSERGHEVCPGFVDDCDCCRVTFPEAVKV